MAHTYRTLVHRWFEEVWNQGREDTIDELLTEDSIAHGLPGEPDSEMRGPDAFKPFVRKFRAAFPDLHFEIEDIVIEGDRIALRCLVTGTHTGPGILPAATGKPIRVTGMGFVCVKDGRFSERWNTFDFLTMYQQLGKQLT